MVPDTFVFPAGIPAHTYNAAGMHPNTVNEQLYSGSTARYNSAATYIKAYYIDWDILSFVQDHFSVTINGTVIDPPSAIGYRQVMDGPYDTVLTINELLDIILVEELVEVYFMVLSHLNPAVLYGLLSGNSLAAR